MVVNCDCPTPKKNPCSLPFIEPLLVRRGHPDRGRCGQLLCLRVGARRGQDQRHHCRLRGDLPHPLSGRDCQEPQVRRGRPGDEVLNSILSFYFFNLYI